MNRRILVSVLGVWLAIIVASVAQDSKAPTATKPAEPKSNSAAVSPIEAVLEAEHADRKRQEQAIAWLREPSEVHFTNIPLKDVAAFLADSHKARIQIRIGDKALSKFQVTMSVAGQPLSHVLNRAMQSPELAWTVHRGDIVITTVEHQQKMLEARIYRVGRLQQLSAARVLAQRLPVTKPKPIGAFGPGGLPTEIQPDDAIISLLQEAIDAPWGVVSSEGGTVSLFGDHLVVRQTFHAHEQIVRLLQTVEAALAREPGSTPLLVMSPEDAQRHQHVQKALRRELKLQLVETALDDVAKMLAKQIEAEVFVDRAALKEEKVSDDVALDLADGSYTAQDALQQALEPHHLAAVIDDGAIRVTTAQAAGRIRQTVVYDVADLVRIEDDIQSLQKTVIDSTSGPWQSRDGEGGTLTAFPGGLFVIRQTEAIHTEIALLLHELRQVKKDAPKEAARSLLNDIETRFYKTKSKDEAEALERLILTFVAPTTWDSSGGKGLLRTAEDRIIIQQTKAVHDQLDQFLREYQQAKPLAPAK